MKKILATILTASCILGAAIGFSACNDVEKPDGDETTFETVLVAGKSFTCSGLEIKLADNHNFDEITLENMLSLDNPYRNIYLNSTLVFEENGEFTWYYGEWGAITNNEDSTNGTYEQTENVVYLTFNSNGDYSTATLIQDGEKFNFCMPNNGYDLLLEYNLIT